jgi:hypothetical protein
MDNPLQSAVQKMGGNFLVAAFTPSLAFVLSAYVAFWPLFRDLVDYQPEESLSFIQSGIVLFLAATILGFTIYTIEIYIYKAFEGYVFILGGKNSLRDRFLKKHRLRYRKAMAKKQLLQRQLNTIERKLAFLIDNPAPGKSYNKRLSRLITQREQLSKIKYDLTAGLDHNYPPSESDVMPTRFGNILCAAEKYSGRYGIDAVALWAKLVSSIPDSDGMMEKINEANNQCQFLLNGALLGTAFSALCMLAAALKGAMWWSDASQNFSDGKSAILYATLMVFSAIVAFFFYEASLFNVEKFGEMIRTTYDLHRFHLLEALHMELPPSLVDEKKIWLKLSHFATGNFDYKEWEYLTEDTLDLVYSHPIKKTISR